MAAAKKRLRRQVLLALFWKVNGLAGGTQQHPHQQGGILGYHGHRQSQTKAGLHPSLEVIQHSGQAAGEHDHSPHKDQEQQVDKQRKNERRHAVSIVVFLHSLFQQWKTVVLPYDVIHHLHASVRLLGCIGNGGSKCQVHFHGGQQGWVRSFKDFRTIGKRSISIFSYAAVVFIGQMQYGKS